MWSINIVRRYIRGMDVFPYNVDELEENPDFMALALKESKDKRLYRLCSDKIKTDSDFVLKIMECFKTDINFVSEVLDYYLGNTKEDKTIYYEVLALGTKITKNVDYACRLMAVYVEERCSANELKRKAKNDDEVMEVGLGFGVMEYVYAGCHEFLRFMAARLLEDIFDDEALISFEELIHSKFRSIDNFKQYGYRTFMIDYVRTIDIYLADFLSANYDLLDNNLKRCEEIIKRWPYYMRNLNERRQSIVYQEIERFAREYNASYLPLFVILRDVLREMGLQDKFEKIDDEEVFYNPMDIIVMRFKRMLKKLLSDLFKEDLVRKDSIDYLVLKNKNGSNF